tara:strand:- start:261 stop:473 length:213 start_codon:yes stop_codon:yes gene_type:complete
MNLSSFQHIKTHPKPPTPSDWQGEPKNLLGVAESQSEFKIRIIQYCMDLTGLLSSVSKKSMSHWVPAANN